ncbi:MAG TPA: NAD(P)-dependent oxidoreductase [Candidatus Baltobacteraceae bacterium]|jgi:3-hydroxyisobutyrate dehydrogenase-like beta-hydroxyacid dehydrogenase
MSETIGFIGVGAMGEPMARALRRAGFAVTASVNTNRAPLERLAADGVVEAADPAAVAAASSVVITMVPDAPHVADALFGPAGAMGGANPGTLFIDMSTISPIASEAHAARLREAGHAMVDAPVSGGPARAATGTLAIMAGGSEADFARAEPVLRAMGTPHHVGGTGMGATIKLVNQVMIASIMIANVEALTFAKRAGADPEVVRAVVANATGGNYLLDQWLPKYWLAGTFEGGFAIDLLRKDINAALEAARAMKLAMPSTAAAYQVYTAQSAGGDGALDYSAVAKFYERLAGHHD